MFGIKTKIKQKYQAWVRTHLKLKTFPTSSVSNLTHFFLIKALKPKLRQEAKYTDKQTPITPKANPFSQKIYQSLAEFNPNNLGSWLADNSPFTTSQEAEKAVLCQLSDLFKADAKKLDGYINSGSTESNLLACWLGREYLQKKIKPDRKICLLSTDLSHYSVNKTARITNLDQKIVPLSQNNWSMDPASLKTKVTQLQAQGYSGYILNLTLGYTATGSSDPVEDIVKTCQKLKKTQPELHFFAWIDAAFSGLIYPFLTDFSPFKHDLIKLINLDYHKFGGVHYPAGVVLFRKKLKKLIEQEVSYLPISDSTLLGSRPGLNALAIWLTNLGFGQARFKRLIDQCLARKKNFLDQLDPNLTVVTDRYSVQAGIVAHNEAEANNIKELGLKIENYQLNFSQTDKTSHVKIAKVYFLPKF